MAISWGQAKCMVEKRPSGPVPVAAQETRACHRDCPSMEKGWKIASLTRDTSCVEL